MDFVVVREMRGWENVSEEERWVDGVRQSRVDGLRHVVDGGQMGRWIDDGSSTHLPHSIETMCRWIAHRRLAGCLPGS